MKLNGILDRDGIAVFMHRSWQAFAGLLTLILISYFLSPQEQGVYYTFASIAAIQTILDMGLSVVLVQLAAHKFLGMSWASRGLVLGEASTVFLSFVRCATIWYGIAAVLFLFMYPLGLWFFSDSPDIYALDYPWRTIWLVLIVFTSLNLLLQSLLSVIEGSGQVVEIYKLRLLQTVLGAIAAWTAFFFGYGLFAVCMLPMMSGLVSIVWLVMQKRDLLRSIWHAKIVNFSWLEEVWPLQWRIGISWICGYFLTQLYTPILFKTQGAIAAGQMGLSITVINMIGLIALSGMTAKIPRMGQLAAARQYHDVDVIFRRGIIGSFILYSLGAIVALGLLYILVGTQYHVRFLPQWQFFILLIAIFAANGVNALAAYCRVYKQERLMWLYIANAMLASSMAYIVAPYWGSAGIVVSLGLINVFLILPVALLLWFKFRQRLTQS